MTKHPNVLFIMADAFRPDRMSAFGYERPTTPNLARLMEGGLSFSQAVCNAAFTQPSYHSLMTSSRPLSYGGYDNGVFNRPSTIFSAFHRAGYRVCPFSTFQWLTPLMGYEEGMDDASYLFVINTLVGVAAVTLRNQIELYAAGKINEKQLADQARPLLMRSFESIESYCVSMATQTMGFAEFADSRLINDRYDYPRIRKLVISHKRQFETDPQAYIRAHFHRPFAAHDWLAHEWRLYREIGKLVGEGAGKMLNRALSFVDPKGASLRDLKFKRYVDAGSVSARIKRALRAHAAVGDGQPFMIWTHLLDTHVPYCAGKGRKWYKQTPGYLRRLGYGDEVDVSTAAIKRPSTEKQWSDWSALYDAAVSYVDEQVGEIISCLEELRLRDDTLVVFASDHGEELGEHGDISHHFRFYEHNVRVPMIFNGPGIDREQSTSLITLLDLAPSLTNFAGIASDPAWEGQYATAPEVASRDHAIMESFHGGGCMFDARPPYFAVRTPLWKYLWRECRDKSDRYSAETPELYDLFADPGETRNLYDPQHPKVAEFNPLIASRIAEIPELGPEKAKVLYEVDLAMKIEGAQ